MSSYSCPKCGGTATSAATCCGMPMGSLAAANQSAISLHLVTGGAQAARAAAKSGRRP